MMTTTPNDGNNNVTMSFFTRCALSKTQKDNKVHCVHKVASAYGEHLGNVGVHNARRLFVENGFTIRRRHAV